MFQASPRNVGSTTTIRDTPPRSALYINNKKLPPASFEQVIIPNADITAISINPSAPFNKPILIVNLYNPQQQPIINELRQILLRYALHCQLRRGERRALYTCRTATVAYSNIPGTLFLLFLTLCTLQALISWGIPAIMRLMWTSARIGAIWRDMTMLKMRES